VCVGDYENDLALLGAADVAVCPGNAVDSVKAISKYMVCHCKDGALADMIDLIESVVCK
jgi:hydroxymethylpyrimidine pyrophosphatase-like HAD family hydrolase